MEREFFINSGKRNLFCFMQFPDNFKEKDPIAILMHGLLVDCRSYPLDNIANYFLSKGFAVCRFDFNGHGRSDGEFVDMTVPREVDDAKSVLEYIKNTFEGSRIVLLGHSQGGTVASMVSGCCSDMVDALILMAPGAALEDACNEGRVGDVVFDPDNIPDRIFVLKQIFGGEYFRTGRFLHVYQVCSQFKGPVCLIHGGYDRLIPLEYSLRFHRTYSDSSLCIVSEADHWFYKGLDRALKFIDNFISEKFFIK